MYFLTTGGQRRFNRLPDGSTHSAGEPHPLPALADGPSIAGYDGDDGDAVQRQHLWRRNRQRHDDERPAAAAADERPQRPQSFRSRQSGPFRRKSSGPRRTPRHVHPRRHRTQHDGNFPHPKLYIMTIIIEHLCNADMFIVYLHITDV